MITKEMDNYGEIYEITFDDHEMVIKGLYYNIDNICRILNANKELTDLVQSMYPVSWKIIEDENAPFFDLGSAQIDEACLDYVHVIKSGQTHLTISGLE